MKRSISLYFLLFLSGFLVSRIMVSWFLRNEIIYTRMIFAGFGADIAFVSLLVFCFILISVVLPKKSIIQFLSLLSLVLCLGFIYTNHRHVLVNHQIIPLKNIISYIPMLMEDRLLRRGISSELLSVDLIFIAILPLLAALVWRKRLFQWISASVKQKLLMVIAILVLGVAGNGMKWSFDVVRVINSPLMSNYIYYWIEKPYDKTILDHSFPKDIDRVVSFFEQPEKPVGKVEAGRKYNILIIIVESFRAAENSAYGADPGVTPYFEKLSKKGILFTNIYHNGCCSPEGMLAVLCAQQPQISYITVNQTYAPFTCLPDYLSEQGYQTSWVHALGSGADRFGAFHRFHKTEHIIDGFQFPENAKHAGWAYADEETLKLAKNYWNQLDEPLYMVIQTLSTHSPYSVPSDYQKKFDKSGKYYDYLNSLSYVDEQVGLFVEDVLNSEKGKDTIVVITADHSVQLPTNRIQTDKDSYLAKAQIPLLIILPDELNHYSSTIDTLGSQLDVLPTLLDILGAPPIDATYGYSLLQNKKSPRFVYVTEFGNESLITKDFVMEISPKTGIFDWKGKQLNNSDTLQDWRDKIDILKNYNMWGISLTDKNKRQLFLTQNNQKPLFSSPSTAKVSALGHN